MLDLLTAVRPRFTSRSRILANDLGNRLRYGSAAPIYAERIWVRPADCSRALLMPSKFTRPRSGSVVEAEFPPSGFPVVPVVDIPRIRSCIEHWIHGVPWEETAMFRAYLQKVEASTTGDPRAGREGILRMLDGYDAMYEQIRKDGRLKVRAELGRTFREERGIMVHVGPDGELYHGNSGNRRLAIALCLGLEVIPAMIGMVHRNGIRFLPRLRVPPSTSRKGATGGKPDGPQLPLAQAPLLRECQAGAPEPRA